MPQSQTENKTLERPTLVRQLTEANWFVDKNKPQKNCIVAIHYGNGINVTIYWRDENTRRRTTVLTDIPSVEALNMPQTVK